MNGRYAINRPVFRNVIVSRYVSIVLHSPCGQKRPPCDMGRSRAILRTARQ